MLRRRNLSDDVATPSIDTSAPAYKYYLLALAIVPMLGLLFDFRQVQKTYAIVGAFFVPMLALVLLLLNSRSDWVGKRFRNGWPTLISLTATIIFFLWIAVSKLSG